MEALEIHTGAPSVHSKDNTSCISVVEAKTFTPRVKHIDIPLCFQQEKLTIVSLFQNTRSLVSCQKICAPNHVQVQLSVRVLNELLDSDYIQPVIQNAIN